MEALRGSAVMSWRLGAGVVMPFFGTKPPPLQTQAYKNDTMSKAMNLI